MVASLRALAGTRWKHARVVFDLMGIEPSANLSRSWMRWHVL